MTPWAPLALGTPVGWTESGWLVWPDMGNRVPAMPQLDMTLTPEQTKALDRIQKWYKKATREALCMGGYAGTGKTTLLQHFINGLDFHPLCCAPTGKAASVLQKKLVNATVSTIHRALYCPVDLDTSELDELEEQLLKHPNNAQILKAIDEAKVRLSKKDVKFSLNGKHGITGGQLVIIDEASMVTQRMRDDLEATGAKLLYVGDPGQLPPVNDRGFFADAPPDVMLTEVQRQALDNPIVNLSMNIRNGVIPGYFTQGKCRHVAKGTLPPETYLEFDQVITGKNETRRKINRFFRKQTQRADLWPKEGERVVCLRNDTTAGQRYINGVQGVMLTDARVHPHTNELEGDLLYDGTVATNVPLYKYPFEAHYHSNAVEEPYTSRQGLKEFDFAYAITVHKSQGSEWDRVVVADDEMMSNNTEFRKKWLYTAVTRAKEELIWIS